MTHFINRDARQLRHRRSHVGWGLDKITVVEVVDAGPWVPKDEAYIAGRGYTQKFGLTIELDFSYEPVEV